MTTPDGHETPDRAAEHLGNVYRDRENRLWEVVGYIDKPAIRLRSVIGADDMTLVIGSPLHAEYERLIPEATRS